MSRQARVTIRDLARHLGLSTSTVSTSLTGRLSGTHVSAATRELVRHTAHEMGYSLDHLRSLRTQPRRVAVLCPDTRDALYYGTALDVVRLLSQRDCQAIVNLLPSHEAACNEAISLYRRRVVDAVVFVGFRVQTEDLGEEGVPNVVVADMPPGAPVWRVGVDNMAGGAIVGEHLWSLGHRRAGWIGTSVSPVVSAGRLAGLREAWEAKGAELPDRSALTLEAFSSYELGMKLPAWLSECSRRGAPLTALFFFNDILAAEGLRILRGLKIEVPEQVSVVGFDDMMFAEWVDPALTTVRQPFTEMGAAALELLGECLAGGDQPARQRIFDCELVVRASTGAVSPRM